MKVAPWEAAINRWASTLERKHTGIFRMDMTWLTGRIALGGGIWNETNMAEVARAGITHIIDMQQEFDDTPLAAVQGIKVLWNATDDDFQPKHPALLQRGVDFALEALERDGAKLYIHCAAGVHRAPMMALAVLCSLGWDIDEAMNMIENKRPIVDFADVYVESVQGFLEQQPAKAER
ncbi:MAG: dual specificity protein phosphatase family protein [Acidobacteriales bacterium]|nr:dual specificity protein phosphatase family protein [Terriglobales bacterium]